MSLTLRLVEWCYGFVSEYQISCLIAVVVTLHFLFLKRRLRNKPPANDPPSQPRKATGALPQKENGVVPRKEKCVQPEMMNGILPQKQKVVLEKVIDC